MSISIEPNKVKLNAADLSQFESDIGTLLPEDYRDFLLESNGGEPESNQVKLSDAEDFDVRIFFGIDDSVNGLARFREVYIDRVPAHFLPIANDNCGNLFVLSIAGGNIGDVCFWDHEREADDGEPPRTDNLTLIANSFSQFVARLEPWSGSEVRLMPGQVKSVWVDPEFKAKFDRGEL